MVERDVDFQQVFEALPGHYLVLLPDLTIVAASESYLEATMTRREAILGRHIFQVFPENPAAPAGGVAKLRESLETVLAERRSHTMLVTKYDIPRPDSQGGGFEERFWSPVNAPVLDADGRVAFIVHRVEDITDFVRLREEGHRMEAELFVRAKEVEEVNQRLRQANASLSARERERERLVERLQELDELRSAFFANVSHEFRTPLTLLLGVLEHADPSRPLDPHERETVLRSARRVLKLVDTLLDLSRIEAGWLDVTFAPCDLAAFTEDVASMFRSTIERAGLAFEVDCDPLPEPVFVDRESYEKILSNLLANAFKHTLEGRVTVRLRAAGERVRLSVEDTGVGIGPEDARHVFERFRRVRGAVGRSAEGTGIGLALARELVEVHGGTISLTSEPGRGSTFTVELLRGTAHLPQERIGPAAAAPAPGRMARSFVEEAAQWVGVAGEEASAPDPASAPRRGRVLLADDNADMRRYVATILGQLWEVEAVADGVAAYEAARRAPPDCVVADIMMPGLDGLRLLAALRADAETERVPVVLVSARAGDEARVAGLEAGAAAYLAKPFSARELVSLVDDLVERRRRERALAEESVRKDQFLAMLGHELRNPLAPLTTAIDLLSLRGEDPHTRERCLGIMGRQVRHLTRMVDDLVDVARVAQGKVELRPERVDLRSVVERSVEVAGLLLQERGHKLVVTQPPRRLEAFADPVRLEQVLVNLLSNAARYTPPGGRVELALSREGDEACLLVRDTGVGLSAEDLARVFLLFEQVAPFAGAKGLGVGLTIAKRLVELHGGTIEARSAGRGRGSEFLVRLPLLAGAEPAPTALEPAGEGGAIVPAVRRVLIVDDNAAAADLLAQLIGEWPGHQARAVYHPRRALEALDAWSPDLLLVDLGLPDMSGYELAEEILATRARPPALIAVTGYGQPEDRERCLLAGFADHLVKPVLGAELSRVLRANLAPPVRS